MASNVADPVLGTTAVATHSAPKQDSERRLVALDGVRGIAILMVLFWHYYSCVPRPEWVTTVPLLETIAAYGWAGVPLFFALSGFLIGRILLNERGKPGWLQRFAVRRSARILPPYLLCIGLYALALFVMPTHAALEKLFRSEAPFWSYTLFQQNVYMANAGGLGGHWLSVTWSLAVEVQFYVFIALVVMLAKPTALRYIMVALVVFAIVFRWAALEYQFVKPAALIVLLPARIDAFALGVLVATLPVAAVARVPRWFAALGVMGCIVCIGVLRSVGLGYLAMLYCWIAAGFSVVLLHLRRSPEGNLAGVLSWGPLVWCGSVSYFVYLFHQPMNHFVHFAWSRTEPNLGSTGNLVLTVVSALLVFGAAELSRRYYEQPIMRFASARTRR